jgi:hypothetical protein
MGDSSRRVLAAGALAVSPMVLAGCLGFGSSSSRPQARVPKPRVARFVPRGYRVTRLYRASLDGGRIPDTVVLSSGPPTGSLHFRSADLQVLSWDSNAKRWSVAFDAQRAPPRPTPSDPRTSNNGVESASLRSSGLSTRVLDPKADVTVGGVNFVRFRPAAPDLVFNASMSYGGSGLPGELVVVGFAHRKGKVAYFWYGDGGVRYRVLDRPSGQKVEATANYWTKSDAHCCPIRKYRFVVGASRRGSIDSIRDVRPWLGVLVKSGLGFSRSALPLPVTDVVSDSPAAGIFRPGDEILSVRPRREIRAGPGFEQTLLDQINSLNAGDRARFVIRRNGGKTTLTVRLGSIIDPSALRARPPNNDSISAL